MNILSVTLISVAGLFTASCSKHSGSDGDRKLEAKSRQEFAATKQSRARKPQSTGSSTSEADSTAATETDSQPRPEQIGEDCVGFTRSTRTVPRNGKSRLPRMP